MGTRGRDWRTDRRELGERHADSALVWKIAAGVTLGIVVATAFTYFVDYWRTRAFIDATVHELAKALNWSTSEVDRANRSAAAREAEAMDARARQERLRRQAIAEREQARAAEKADVAAEAARKERAWAKYYQRPEICGSQAINDQQMIKCANEYIRAKRAFEELYAKGRL